MNETPLEGGGKGVGEGEGKCGTIITGTGDAEDSGLKLADPHEENFFADENWYAECREMG